jgi:PAS domain S-box-containing protein
MIIQKNLRRALDESSMVAITDKNGLIKYVNKQFCETTEYSSDELIGKNHDLIRSGYHSIEFYDNLWNIINSGKVWHGEVKNISKTGKIFWCDLIIVPFLDKYGDVHEHIAIRRNITKQKKFYEDNLKNEKMITVGRFSARLAHDLRNPLSIIQVSLENLRLLYGTNESQQKSMDKVERSIDRITHQVDDVLDFVRERPITLNNHTMSEIISESLDSLPIPDNIKLILPKNNVEVYCDEKQFAIVFNNLILNGVQAIVHTGTIEITVEENNDGIIIQIMDSGEGIPKENIDSLFEPLFTTKQQGTGLGLASVKSIVEAHGGIISVSSPPTVFTITLPKISDN